MGKIEFFFIKLEKKNPIYFSEETINGSLIIKVKERIKIEKVCINIKGMFKMINI